MKNYNVFTLIVAAMLPGAAAAQCTMAFNISVYEDGSVSGDYSTIYGYSNFIDNSQTCGCSHNYYESTVYISDPNGVELSSSQQAGQSSNTSAAINGNLGTYEVYGDSQLVCSCKGQINVPGNPGGYPVQASAILSVVVTQLTCSPPLMRTSGSCQFVVGASANGNWTGTVSGTITISDPANPSNVLLSDGAMGNPSITFSLTAGQSTTGSCSPSPGNAFCFTMSPGMSNTNSGTVTYTVTLNNGTNYTVASGHQVQQVSYNVP